MSQSHYFAANESDEEERNRLRMQEEFNDPRSINRFEMIGVSKGWNCLEVGAGSGSMAEYLANFVGANGKVVATDINTRFLKRLKIPNLEVRQHDILNDELEKEKYDFAHCRSLIMHLKEPEKALRRMAEAVCPGGWLCVEQTDYGSVTADLTNPSAAFFNTIVPTIYSSASKMGIADWYIGRRIPSMIEKLGFIEVAHEGRNQVIRGGSTQAMAQIKTMQIQIKKLITAGLITEQQNDDIQRLYHDPDFFYMGPTYFGVWGRKPKNKG